MPTWPRDSPHDGAGTRCRVASGVSWHNDLIDKLWAASEPVGAQALSSVMPPLPNPAKAVILLVEDEPVIRMLAADALVDAGFQVIEADHGAQALDVLRERADGIHAVFTDVHMPGSINGVALAHEASRCWPWLRLLVASGHAMPSREELPAACRFLPKPYSLAHVIRQLDELTQP